MAKETTNQPRKKKQSELEAYYEAERRENIIGSVKGAFIRFQKEVNRIRKEKEVMNLDILLRCQTWEELHPKSKTGFAALNDILVLPEELNEFVNAGVLIIVSGEGLSTHYRIKDKKKAETMFE